MLHQTKESLKNSALWLAVVSAAIVLLLWNGSAKQDREIKKREELKKELKAEILKEISEGRSK